MYWSAEVGDPVLRGTWFFQDSWIPLEENMADCIEREHVARWKGYNIEEVQVTYTPHDLLFSFRIATEGRTAALKAVCGTAAAGYAA